MTFLAPTLAVLLPLTLFVRTLLKARALVKPPNKPHGANLLWLAAYLFGLCFASAWLATSLLAVLSTKGLSAPQVQATLNGGPYLFLALLLVVELRPVLRQVVRGLRGIASKVAALRRRWAQARARK